MEAISNYLNTMFINMPNTPEVLRAKDELWQMMEDKYTELKSEGKSENEAVGTVISEFGNLDELSDVLGIDRYVQNPCDFNEVKNGFTVEIPARTVNKEETDKFLRDSAVRAIQIGIGVLLCILSPVCPTLAEGIGINDAIGMIPFFIMIAIAVGLLIFSSIKYSKWDYLKKEQCIMDFATIDYIKKRREENTTVYAIFLVIGIGLCIVSVIPCALLDELNVRFLSVDMEAVGCSLFLALVAIGVFFIISSSLIKSSFNSILKYCNCEYIENRININEQKRNQPKPSDNVSSLFWSTVACIYFSYSFLTFNWGTSWLIWPVASVIYFIIKIMMDSQE